VTAAVKLGPNDLVPCPSRSARKRHAALGQLCPICEPEIERPGLCPVCKDRISVIGDRYDDHSVDSGVWCPGSGASARQISSLAATFRTRRVELGWTQEELARRAGVNKGIVSSFEAGVSPLLARNRQVLAIALEFDDAVVARGAA
jgi:DNA-binding XRE family transcriptional regulator